MRGQPVFPVFVVVPQAAERLATLSTLLSPLAASAASARLLSVDVYYREGTDMALLALHFDAQFVTPLTLEQLTSDAARVAGAVLDPARLPEDARQRFFTAYLPQYTLCASDLGGVDAALRALSRHMQVRKTPVPMPAAHGDQGILVRFRRGDCWQLGRVRSLTREVISVATSAPPRKGDTVDVELASGTLLVACHAQVVAVTADGAASLLGAPGFGARLCLDSPAEQAALDSLLAQAGDPARSSMPPPPRRREARYPVNWPVLVRTPRGKANFAALDVSRHGLFLGVDGCAPTAHSTSVHVTLPVDVPGGPVVATARIARAIPADIASSRGLTAGYGLELTALSLEDAARFGKFVDRVGKRAVRSIVVGAAPSRLEPLCAELAGAGYSAAGASDAPSLVARAAAAACAPDLVVLDASMAVDNPRGTSAARRALGVRSVPILTLDGEPPTACREWADAALLGAA